MGTKLDWVYQDRSGEYHAAHKGLVIRAIRDDSPQNPFEDSEGYWPMAVLYDRRINHYDDTIGVVLDQPLARLNDHELVLMQKHIDKVLGDGKEPWIWDADELRDEYDNLVADGAHAATLDQWAALYAIVGIPHLRHTSRGYSQSDWAELLIVATPEAQAALRPQPADMDAETWAKTLAEDMAGQAKLYDAWAWGDVYGYVLARWEQPDDFEDDPDYRELVDRDDVAASCWGYYGSDFDWSGLEDAAIEAVDGFVKEQANVAT